MASKNRKVEKDSFMTRRKCFLKCNCGNGAVQAHLNATPLAPYRSMHNIPPPLPANANSVCEICGKYFPRYVVPCTAVALPWRKRFNFDHLVLCESACKEDRCQL